MPALLERLHRDLPPVPPGKGADPAAVVIPLSAAALFLLVNFHFRPRQLEPHLRSLDLGAWAAIAPHCGWFLAALVLFLVVPVALLVALREPLGEYGLGPGRWRFGLAAAGALGALMVPAAVLAARHPGFGTHYPLAQGATGSWGLFAVYELCYALYFVGWEAIFRGYLLFGLYRRIGVHAVYVLALPFALVHQSKPEAEAFGSIVAGVALGWLALRARSFWWGALLHAGVAFAMDLAAGLSRLAR
jgi:membrane protease YdiL (CAAX protease family)